MEPQWPAVRTQSGATSTPLQFATFPMTTSATYSNDTGWTGVQPTTADADAANDSNKPSEHAPALRTRTGPMLRAGGTGGDRYAQNERATHELHTHGP